MALADTINTVIGRIFALKPVRVLLHYGAQRGPLLAGGLSFQAIFAIFAAIWLGFSIAGSIVARDPRLEDALLGFLATNVPGLIDTGDGNGAIDPAQLLSTGTLGWTGAIAAVGLLATAVGWIGACREAVRSIFGMPGLTTFFLLLFLRDLALAIGFGALIIASAALSVLSTSALSTVLGWLSIDSESDAAVISARVVGLLLALAIDTMVLALFFRVVAGVPIPVSQLLHGAVLGAVALGILKSLASVLLAGATRNPLLASFAVIIGLLVWFNLICRVILIAASWIRVSADDANIRLGTRSLSGTPSGGTPSGVGPAL